MTDERPEEPLPEELQEPEMEPARAVEDAPELDEAVEEHESSESEDL